MLASIKYVSMYLQVARLRVHVLSCSTSEVQPTVNNTDSTINSTVQVLRAIYIFLQIWCPASEVP